MRSARYRDFLQPQGYDDELRVVFRTAGKSWGVGGPLPRAGPRPVRRRTTSPSCEAVSPIVAAAFRTHAALTAPTPGFTHAPGLMLFDRDGAIISANDAASRWLAEIYGEDPGTDWFEILAGLAQPRRRRRHPDHPAHRPGPRRRRRAATPAKPGCACATAPAAGSCCTRRCSTAASGDGNVAIVVEPAKSGDLAPIIIEAYGLTPRERDVVRAIARGSSTPEIAAELFLSAHTVRDYIKAVFDKVGVSSRGELVAKLFAEHYADPFHETLVEVH